MKDERGLYYLPSLQTRTTRMYVRETDGVIEFRLWSGENPEIWERHEWIPLDVVRKAAELYKNPERNPLGLYDLEVAKRLLQDDKRENPS